MDTLPRGKNDAKPALPPVISVGAVSVLSGRVYFSDRFIKPNDSANLTELTGKLSMNVGYVVQPDGQLTASNIVRNQLTFGEKVEGASASLPVKLPASEAAMHELALQRGVRVRDYLAARKRPSEHWFLGAAKAIPPEAKWSPRAELNLTTR